MALAAKLYRSDDDRQAERHAVEVDATLRDPSNAAADTIVLDLSASGFRATVPAPIAPGGKVKLGLPGLGTNPATVIWQSGNLIGCQFDRPIADADIARAQSTNTVVEGLFTVEPGSGGAARAQALGGPMMVAGMPFALAITLSTGISVAWAAVMLHLIQQSLADLLVV